MFRQFVCNYSEPVVATKRGKVRGYTLDGINTFHGIPYAKAERFMMPEPADPWEGVLETVNYGPVCPLLNQHRTECDLETPRRFWPENEQCQYLNVWSKDLNPAAKKPVMFWIHGGGFFDGSSIEMVCYEGYALADYGDVVVVSINHRLNMFGYLDLSSSGERYWNSGNVGMADIVVALQWVRENIAAFGGDPDNVTVFGQSGGGGKINTLLQMPAAEGLFQKASIMSGIGITRKCADGAAIAKEMLKVLGTDDVSTLEKLCTAELILVYNKALPALKAADVCLNWSPVPNRYYPGDPMQVGFSEMAKRTPTMVGSVLSEFSYSKPKFDKKSATAAETMERLTKQFGEDAPALLAEFRSLYPEKKDLDLLDVDTRMRLGGLDYLDVKAKVASAPLYNYLFTLTFPINDGMVAWHTAEVPYVFHNAELLPVCTIPGVSEKVEDTVCGAWVAFAYGGNPGTKALPWPAYTERDPVTMVFDRENRTIVGDDRAFLEKLEAANKVPSWPTL